MNNKEFLEKIKNGQIDIDQGLAYLKDFNYQDLDFAKLDFQRKESVIRTRASFDQFDKVLEKVPESTFDKTADIKIAFDKLKRNYDENKI